jgi:hypothetical protein
VDPLSVRSPARALAFATLMFACDRKERHETALPTAKSAPSVVPSVASRPSPQPAPSVSVTILPSGRRVRVRQMSITKGGETTCSMTDFGETFNGGLVIEDREVYSFPQMNAQLRKYPEFAATVGLAEVKTCEDARHYDRRYAEYKKLHPDFDDEGPTKEEQFKKFLSDPNNVAKPRDMTQ